MKFDKEVLQDPWAAAATWFGAGLSPKAPGTVGSIAAIPFAVLIQWALGGLAFQLLAIGLFFGGIIVCDRYMRKYSREGDPQEIVIDEVAAMWLLLSFFYRDAATYIFALIMFRAFDIYKPWPVNIADRDVKGGFGVMLDDLLAALYAAATTLLFVIFIRSNV